MTCNGKYRSAQPCVPGGTSACGSGDGSDACPHGLSREAPRGTRVASLPLSLGRVRGWQPERAGVSVYPAVPRPRPPQPGTQVGALLGPPKIRFRHPKEEEGRCAPVQLLCRLPDNTPEKCPLTGGVHTGELPAPQKL